MYSVVIQLEAWVSKNGPKNGTKPAPRPTVFKGLLVSAVDVCRIAEEINDAKALKRMHTEPAALRRRATVLDPQSHHLNEGTTIMELLAANDTGP